MTARDDPAVPVDHAFVCEACASRWYYTRERCPDCGADDVATERLRTGRVLATTTVHATPPDVRTPNSLGLVRFDDVTLIAQLADNSTEAGDAVEFGDSAVLRDGDPSTDGPRLVRPDPRD